MLHPAMLFELARQEQTDRLQERRSRRRRSADPGRPTAAIIALQPLMQAAGELDIDDRTGWARLRTTADPVLARLVMCGALPSWMRLRTEDPPARISAVLTAAWVHATGPAQVRHHRR